MYFQHKKALCEEHRAYTKNMLAEREIRTPGGRKSSTVFKTAAINRSAISPL